MPASRREINLLPKDGFSETFGGKILTWALTVGRYIVIITQLVVIVAFLSRFRYDMQLAEIRDEIKNNQEVIASFQDLEEQFRYFQARIKNVEEISNTNSSISGFYQEISQITPKDVYFKSISVSSNNSISLEGVALSDVGLVTLLNQIKNKPSFTESSLNYLNSKGERDPELEFLIVSKVNLSLKNDKQ